MHGRVTASDIALWRRDRTQDPAGRTDARGTHPAPPPTHTALPSSPGPTDVIKHAVGKHLQ